MYYMDAYVCMIQVGYGRFTNMPFTLYGEYFFATAQTLILVILVWSINKTITFMHKAIAGTFLLSMIIFFTSEINNAVMWEFHVWSFMFVAMASKMPQIVKNFKNKSTGQLSLVMILT
jgi:mannose-P-dolichol utilization defect protein 1